MDDARKVHTHPSAHASALDERLAAARERLREARAKREARQAELDKLAEVEAAEREAADEAAIAEAEAEYGAVGDKLAVIHTELGAVVLKRPHPNLYRRFRDKGDVNTTAMEKLVRPCVVYPDAGRLDRLLDERPATLDRCANAVVELAGFRAKEVAGK